MPNENTSTEENERPLADADELMVNGLASTHGGCCYHLVMAGLIGLGTFCTRLILCQPFFSYEEDLNFIYADDELDPDVRIYYINHATILLKLSENKYILTDPILEDKIGPCYYSQLPKIGKTPQNIIEALTHMGCQKLIISISHFHRDHWQAHAIKSLVELAQQANIEIKFILPSGGSKYVSKLFSSCCGCSDSNSLEIKELQWLAKDDYPEEKNVEIIALPADHWSNQGCTDVNDALCNGYCFRYQDEEKDTKARDVLFLGDTATYTDKRLEAMLQCLYKPDITIQSHKIVLLSPVGPNFRRAWMEKTHMSILDTMMLPLRILCEIRKNNTELNVETTLFNMSVIAIHQNTFSLGPDRFNEGYFLFIRALDLIKNKSTNEIIRNIEIEEKKSFWKNSLGRNEAFLYEGVQKILQKASELGINKEVLVNYFNTRIHFPRMNKNLNLGVLYGVTALTPAYQDWVKKSEVEKNERAPATERTRLMSSSQLSSSA